MANRYKQYSEPETQMQSHSQFGVKPALLLFCIFLVLKLCHVISWSWWWVTSPLWFWFVVIGLFLGFGVLLGATGVAVGALREGFKSLRKRK